VLVSVHLGVWTDGAANSRRITVGHDATSLAHRRNHPDGIANIGTVVGNGLGAGSPSPAVTRAAGILDLLADAGDTPLGPSELGRRLGVPKSTIANICAALAAVGLVRRKATGYVLGQRVAELGAAYLSGIDEIAVFREVCGELLPAHEATVQIASLGPALDVTYLAHRDGSLRVRLMSHVGRRLPANCTAAGKALLAAQPPADLEHRLAAAERLEALTPKSITDVDRLRAELDRTRLRGWAIDEEETAEGVLCLAAVVPDRTRPPAYAVSFTLLRTRAARPRQAQLATELLDLTGTIAERLGHGSSRHTAPA